MDGRMYGRMEVHTDVPVTDISNLL